MLLTLKGQIISKNKFKIHLHGIVDNKVDIRAIAGAVFDGAAAGHLGGLLRHNPPGRRHRPPPECEQFIYIKVNDCEKCKIHVINVCTYSSE